MNFGISQQDPDKSSVTITPKITIKPGEDSGFQKIQKPNISNGRNFTSIDSKESLIADKASQVLIAEQHESSSTEEEKEFKKDLENAVIFSGEGDTLIAEKVTKMTDLRKIMQAQRENRIGYVYKKEDGSVEIEAQGHMLSQIEQAESVEYQTARGTKTFTNFSGRELTEDQVGQLNISTRVYLVFLAHQEENQVNASGEDLRAAQSAVDSEGVSEAEGFDGLDGLEKSEAAEPSTSSSSSVEEGEQSIEELGAEEINDDFGEVDDDE
ncbi:MAG: hypothetical protein K2X36_12985, partial [Microbacteriaceae bacterium]|nr:hypothetical protein [Microbacteriaceae bacterium]